MEAVADVARAYAVVIMLLVAGIALWKIVRAAVDIVAGGGEERR